jgi:hypothetical protein
LVERKGKEREMTVWEYAVAVRRQLGGGVTAWELWTAQGKIHEDPSFLALMNWAGARGFEAYAAGDFDKMGVPEVMLKRPLASGGSTKAAKGVASAGPAAAEAPSQPTKKRVVRATKAKEAKQ